MAAYGAEVILAPSMEGARDMLLDMERRGLGHCLDQYNNEDNTAAHYTTTGAPGGPRGAGAGVLGREGSQAVRKGQGKELEDVGRSRACAMRRLALHLTLAPGPPPPRPRGVAADQRQGHPPGVVDGHFRHHHGHGALP
jgi:hypothetical protein